MTFFEERYGPTHQGEGAARGRGQLGGCRAEMRALYEEMNLATDGTLHIDSEYLVTIVRLRR